MSQNKQYDEFNELYNMGRADLSGRTAQSIVKLVMEELLEFLSEFYEHHQVRANSNGEVRIDCSNSKESNLDVYAIMKEAGDVRYIMGQKMRQLGFDIDTIEAELHRSNLSKELIVVDFREIGHELNIARKRYPSAYVSGDFTKGEALILRCSDKDKVIKPSTYSPADIRKALSNEKDR